MLTFAYVESCYNALPLFLSHSSFSMISVQNIVKIYGKQKALDGISFEASKGKIVGLLGPNGAGKSTLMKILTGYIPADEGQVLICGQEMGVNRPEMQHLIGYLPEHNPLYLDMYVKEYLAYVAGIYKVDSTRIALMIEEVGLGAEQHKKIKQLSKGFRQRVGLAQALLHNPEVLILDEPTTGLDPNQIVEVRQLIQRLAQEKTVLLSTHLMQEVSSICDEVLILNKGSVVANDSVNNILNLSATKQQLVLEFLEEIDVQLLMHASPAVLRVMSTSSREVLLELDSPADVRREIAAFAAQQGWTVLRMQNVESNLEEVFATLTK